MLKGTVVTTPSDIAGGLVTLTNLFAVQPNQSPNCMNVKFNIGGSIEKRFGQSSLNSVILISSAATGFSVDSDGTLSSNLNAFWKMNEQAGTRADSVDGNDLSAIAVTGALSFTGGIIGNAAFFVEANSQYLGIPGNANLNTQGASFSVDGWFFLTTTGERTLIAKRGGVSSLNLRQGLISYWNLNELSGTRIDSSTSNNLTSNGAVAASNGIVNSAALFIRSSSQYLAISNNGSLQITTNSSFTISAWVYLSTNTATMGIITKGDGPGSTDEDYALILNSGATTRFRFEMDDSAAGTPKETVDASTFGQPGTGGWNLVVCWLDSAAQTLNIQVNNGVIDSKAFTQPIGTTVKPFQIGNFSNLPAGGYFDGRVDEVGLWKRLLTTQERTDLFNAVSGTGKGITFPLVDNQYEFDLFVNTDNVLTFRVSSSGLVHQGQVRATSFGAVGTGTFYNFFASYNSVGSMNVAVNNTLDGISYTGTVFSGGGPLTIGAAGSGQLAYMNGAIDEVGFWKKVLTTQQRTDLYNSGSGETYEKGTSTSGFGSFDFGTPIGTKWLVVSAGTGIFASSNRGVTFVTVATDRSADYQSFFFSKSQLVAVSDSRNQPLIWQGSAATFMSALAVGSAPLTKYGIDFQGFTLLFNSAARPRGVFYEDNNTFTTNTWARSFDVDGSVDDEITGGAILNRILYVSTKKKIFRVTAVGGFPDFASQEMKNTFGYVPRTFKVVTLPDAGDVIIGLCFDKRIRMFDGTNQREVSDVLEQDNKLFKFPILDINPNFFNKCFAVFDTRERVYKLTVVMGQSSETTHTFCLNVRTGAWYPYDNQTINTAVMASSANNDDVLIGVKRDGFVYRLDTLNTDQGVAIDEFFDSSFFHGESPKTVSKSHTIDLYFAARSSGVVYYQDITNFSKVSVQRDVVDFNVIDTSNLVLIRKFIDVPVLSNIYQFRLTTSASNAEPWLLTRMDLHQADLGIGPA